MGCFMAKVTFMSFLSCVLIFHVLPSCFLVYLNLLLQISHYKLFSSTLSFFVLPSNTKAPFNNNPPINTSPFRNNYPANKSNLPLDIKPTPNIKPSVHLIYLIG